MDWKALAPHQPLGEGDPLHVPRPTGDGRRLAAMIRAGLGPFAVAGPVGSGKSTEIAAAAQELRPQRFALVLQLDRTADMRELSEAVVLWSLGTSLLTLLEKPGSIKLALSDEARALLTMTSGEIGQISDSRPLSDALLALSREIKKHMTARLAVFVDGLEKTPERVVRSVVRAYLSVKDEVDLALVVPPFLVTGPENAQLLTELRVFPIRPVPVLEEEGAHWREGRQFLAEVFNRRMGQDARAAALVPLIETAAVASGGLPRAFLQLLRDAGGYAAVANRELPTREDLDSAMRDQADSLRRLLREGDMRALQEADGTDGVEVPLERRVRLLTHGLLLEYEVGDKVVVRMHPLLRDRNL